ALSRLPRHLHSFPTRRSSDLAAEQPLPEPRLVGLVRGRALLVVGVGLVAIARLVRQREPRDEGEAARARAVRIGAVRAFDPLPRSEEHTSELQSRENLVCRLL